MKTNKNHGNNKYWLAVVWQQEKKDQKYKQSEIYLCPIFFKGVITAYIAKYIILINTSSTYCFPMSHLKQIVL